MGKFLLWRVGSMALLSATALTVAATNANALDVATQADWNAAVAAVAAAGSNATVNINFTGGFTLASSLAPLAATASNVTINITGNNNTLNGASAFQGIQVGGANAPVVTISNLIINAMRARGGNGGGGGDGGGGGGLGAGGGLFVATGANVTIDGVSFTNNAAAGGNGGTAGSHSGGSGGGALNGGTGGTAPGGSGTGSAGGVGASGTLYPGSGGVGGTGGGVNVSNGGVGGTGGTGGGGGGGGAATNTHGGGGGGNGGFGGGGGGGGIGGSGGNGAGGLGGYGAGQGGNGNNGTGSGGAGYGGAVFVMDGAVLTVKTSTSFSGNATQSGTGGTPVASRGQDLYINGASQMVTFQIDTGTSTFGGSTQTTQRNIAGEGGVAKTGAGIFVLGGTNSYSGATTVTGGTLIVNGSIASSSGVMVASGATLGGSGTVPTTVLNGGTLSPGNSPGTLTVQGNLTFNPGSTYLAEVQGAVADRVNVTGTAALAGTLRLVPLGGSYTFNSAYTLLSTAGGRSGTFGTVDTTGSFGAGVIPSVSYTASEVLLTLAPNQLSALSVTTPINAASVAKAIDQAVANGGDSSSLFGIYNLPAASIPTAVNSLSGEIHTAAPVMATNAADQFLRAMLDPMAAGRLGAGAPGPGAAAFSGLVRKGADQPALPARLDASAYSVWGSAFGSYGRTDGSAAVGSARRTIDDAHLATGIDVRLVPGTMVGLAVAGGKARASLPGVLGKIDADVFQAGLYGVTQLGPVKLGAAASYTWLDNDVSRGIPALGSNLSSSYDTTAWSGRLQASVTTISWNGLGLSPLAALQATQTRNPAVIEANWAGANGGALTLGKRSETNSRGEFGLQLDADGIFGGMPVTGYVRAAWAHYFQRDAELTASLTGLPGAAFTATGAKSNRNSALIATGISAKLSERISLGLNLDGELASNSRRLGGTAQIKVSF